MMDSKDARELVEELQTKQFLCSANHIETDRYVIMKKEYYDKIKRSMEECTGFLE